MQIQTYPITTQDQITAENKLWTGEPDSTTLIIMLPGRGYTLAAPLHHYLAQIGVALGADVLGIEYPFQAARREFDMAEVPALAAYVTGTVKQFLAERNYEQVILVGKSLGTGLIPPLMGVLDTHRASILLTPVPGAVTTDVPTLAVIGTGDPFYVAFFDEIQSPSKIIQWQTIPDANHALEIPGNWARTVDILQEILYHCETFLKEHMA